MPLSGQSSWGNASVQSDLFGLDQARAALQASKAASRAAEDERRKQILAAADQFESQKMFGNTQEQRSDIQSRDSKDKASSTQAGRSSNGPFRIRKFEVDQVSVQRKAGSRKGTVKEEQPRTKQEHESPRIKHISGLRNGRDTQSASASTTPKLETKKAQAQAQPQLRQKTTVEAPSWVKSGNGDRSTAAVSSWGTAPPPPRSAKEKEAADEAIEPPVYQAEEHANTREIPSQNTAEPDTLRTQATASGPLHESQESDIQPRDVAGNSPLKFETSPTEPRPSKTDMFGSQEEESRRALIQNMTKKPENVTNDQAVRKSSDFGDEEEKMFQALLARRSASKPTAQAEQSGTATFSPMGSLDAEARDALTLQAKEHASEERIRGARQERNEPRQRFRISMSNGINPRDEAKPFDPEISSKWSIFKHRNQQQDQQDIRHNSAPRAARLSAEDIDARFQEHLRGRPRNRVDIQKISLEDPEPQRSTYARRDDNRKCIRCGELGHIARNCNNAPLPDYRPQTRWTQRHGYNPSIHFDSAESDRAQNVNDTDARRADRNPRIRQGLPMSQQDEPEPSKRATEEAEEDDDGEDDAPTERVLKSRKFADEPVREKERTRNVRRGRRDEEDEDDMPSRERRGRFMEDGEDDGAPRRGRRGLFEEENEGELVYENAREARMERKRARQAKKDKLAKDAAKKAASQARRAEELRRIHLPEFISVSNLAQTLGVRYEDFTEKMEELGFSNTSHDHVLTSENASLIAMEYQFDPIIGETEEMEQDERDLRARPEPDDKEFLPTRPPVVAIMGHVDHGKTTILDFLRKSSVAATEHGGITQHIGAFSVGLSSGKTITFLDTPGHAAFLEMRKRGATVTDIIVLVVAADDSVKPQTIEAIKHAKAANVPIIVAINKIDKEEANIERVKQDLARHEVEIEDFGGDTQVVCVSGKTGEGIDQLEDAAVTLSEILDHRAETDGPVEGWVLEATTKKAGRVATVLVKRGTLSPGNIIVAGKTWTRVRSLRNEAGVMIKSAGPGTPIEVDGWKDQPKAGDEVLQAPNEQKASDVVSYREELDERTKMAEDMEAINESRRLETEKRELEREALKLAASSSAQDDDVAAAAAPKAHRDTEVTLGHQTVPFIVKADVSGSVEAVNAYLLQMSNPLCSPTLLRSGVGPVGEFDVEHAAAAGGHIISFNLPASPETAGMAESKGVKVLEQNVIYRIVEQVRTVLEEKLPPVKTQRVLGEAEVAVAFEIGLGGRRKMRIAGCKVRNGVMGRGSRVRILRGGEKVYDGESSSVAFGNEASLEMVY